MTRVPTPDGRSPEHARIAALLGEGEPESRRVAAQRLGALEGGGASELLVRALGDVDWRVRKEASLVAPAVGKRDEVVLALVRALDDKENIGLRNAAVEALIAIGADAVPAAIASLERLDADGRKLAVEILGGIPDLRGTRALAQALRDEDPNVRSSAAEALGSASLAGEEARTEAIAALAETLRSDQMLLKLAALDALARLDAELPWSVFEPLASDPLLRRQAIAAAARSRDKAAIVALATAIGDPSHGVAKEALVALAECVLLNPADALTAVAGDEVRRSPKACDRIRALARASEDPRVRGAAVVALGLVRDPKDLPLLVEALGAEELAPRAEIGIRLFGEGAALPLLEAGKKSIPPVRAATISLVPMLISGVDAPSLDEVRRALGDASADVVAAAAHVIAVAGGGADLATLAPFANHADARVAASACSALHALAVRHPDDARLLLARVDATGDGAVVACVALGAIAKAGRGSASDITTLRAALAHGDARARRAAVEALAAIGGPVAGDAAALALADEEPDVLFAAVRALGRLARSEPLMTLLASAPDAGVVAAALRALSEANPEQAYVAARPLVRSADPAVACAAVEALGSLEGPRREDGLFEALDHSDIEVVKAGLVELSRHLDVRSLARLGLCLDHASWEVRRLAAELLGSDASPAALALLRARLEREGDIGVREALAESLSARPPGPNEGSG